MLLWLSSSYFLGRTALYLLSAPLGAVDIDLTGESDQTDRQAGRHTMDLQAGWFSPCLCVCVRHST